MKDGSSERDNLIAAAAEGNREAKAKLDNAPKLPPHAVYLWEYFCQLHATRPNYGWGAVSLQYSEIEAWARLCHVELDGWELDAILRIDRKFLDSCAKQTPNTEGQ